MWARRGTTIIIAHLRDDFIIRADSPQGAGPRVRRQRVTGRNRSSPTFGRGNAIAGARSTWSNAPRRANELLDLTLSPFCPGGCHVLSHAICPRDPCRRLPGLARPRRRSRRSRSARRVLPRRRFGPLLARPRRPRRQRPCDGRAPCGPLPWLVQTTNDPAYDTVTETGSQGGAASLNTGAWFVSTIDPVTAPRLEDCGDAGEFFLDHATQLYWRDPERFVGLTRIEVEAWLADHPLWRWATAAEVFGLACRLTVGDVPLTAVLGEPQFWATGAQPRWIGYYDQAAEPDGVVLQATYGPPFVMATFVGTQGGAAAWNPGAWVVTSSDPTPTAPTSWSGVKRHFR
jgi:hypothetical protein